MYDAVLIIGINQGVSFKNKEKDLKRRNEKNIKENIKKTEQIITVRKS